MKYRLFSSLQKEVSAVGFGTWALGGETILAGKTTGWGPADKKESLAAIHRALELGVNFFDTADCYGKGQSESILGEALQGRRQKAMVCTKFGIREVEGTNARDFSNEWLASSLEKSLQRLKTDHVDILLLHNPPEPFDFENFDRSCLERFKQEGKILCYGVSCQTIRGAEAVLKAWPKSPIEVIYNVLDRRAESSVLPLAQKSGSPIIARVPLASGFLTGKYGASNSFLATDFRSTLSTADRLFRAQSSDRLEFLKDLPGGMACSALRFCLSHPAVVTAIPGMRTVAQVERNVVAAELGALPEETLCSIATAVPKVFEGWESK